MDAPTIIAGVLSRNQETFIDSALRGITDEDLLYRPNDHTNPIGWLVWHQTRVEDGLFSLITGNPQQWIEGGWHGKFGMGADPQERGIGHTLEQVAAFGPTVENLQGYAAAVREKTLATLDSLTADDLDREVPGPGGNPQKIGQMLGTLMLDHFHHSGQISYLRGSMTPGWAPGR